MLAKGFVVATPQEAINNLLSKIGHSICRKF